MPKEDFLKKIVSIKTETEWNIYKKNYGSLLDSIFAKNDDAKKIMLESLRLLQKGKASHAEILLNELIVKHTETDAEYAAVFFFKGIAAELTGNDNRALQLFTNASLFEPEYYAVYLKSAKIAHREGLYGFAEENYRKTIKSLEKGEYEPKMLSSVYANLCYCLSMMHLYSDAEDALIQSEILSAVLPERESTAAILYAARGEQKKTEHSLSLLSQNANDTYYANTKKLTDRIFAGTHPQFSEIPADEAEITAFWLWFADNFVRYRQIIDLMDDETSSETITNEISTRLKTVFPFYKRNIDVFVGKSEKYTFFFADAYAISLEKGLEQLFSHIPAKLEEQIHLIRIH